MTKYYLNQPEPILKGKEIEKIKIATPRDEFPLNPRFLCAKKNLIWRCTSFSVVPKSAAEKEGGLFFFFFTSLVIAGLKIPREFKGFFKSSLVLAS